MNTSYFVIILYWGCILIFLVRFMLITPWSYSSGTKDLAWNEEWHVSEPPVNDKYEGCRKLEEGLGPTQDKEASQVKDT